MQKAILPLFLIFYFSIAGFGQTTKIDVWDFAADHLDTTLYNNMLTESAVNAWYDASIPVGTDGINLPGTWSAGDLSWTGGGNDRLRTTNTNLTRFDNNISNSLGYLGRIYVNSAANTGRYLSLNLKADDEVTLVTKTQSGGEINIVYQPNPSLQTEVFSVGTDMLELTFTAVETGEYRIYDTKDKPSYYRIYRKPALYAEVSGGIDTTGAGTIPAGYSVVFTNPAGKDYVAATSGDAYQVDLPIGQTFSVGLKDANGYIITSSTTIEVTDLVMNFNIIIKKVDLFEVSGSLTGLGASIYDAELHFTPDPAAGLIYEPAPSIDAAAGTYSVLLEPFVDYIVSATGVNDFYIENDTVSIGATATSVALDFLPRPVFQISIDAPDLSVDQLNDLALTFANVNEPGYDYSFTDVSAIQLRDGVYEVSAGGLNSYPVELGLNSLLFVSGGDQTKKLKFIPVTFWGFDDQVINNGDPAYKGLLFSGQVANEIGKSHLYAKPDATIEVPVNPGDRLLVSYYYTADFTIDGLVSYATNSQSTSMVETASYDYQGSDPGFIVIQMGAGAATTYLTDLEIYSVAPFNQTLTVGQDKDFLTINDALDAIRRMDRPNQERVTILIDPGNYEEMLVIDEPNITLKNASSFPSIDLKNEGVDIDPEAVRITSYYGHGYHYYSMNNNQKWNAEVLAVNLENGYYSYENTGAGTGNGSFWNATVVVFANGFEAEHIIFENAFNQYISEKEAMDVVVEWAAGSPGVRPTDVGNTSVQARSLRERAAALAYADGADKSILYKCRVIGRQDSFFGGDNSRVVMYKGSAMGGVDYIFGGMTAVFYQTRLTMNTADDSNDRTYITAARQLAGRGYLMYECHIDAALPGTETASQYLSKPGYFGRPWIANTSEVVFYKTLIDTSGYPGQEGNSLITAGGWNNSLGGESSMMYEYSSFEVSGVDNSMNRADWATTLTTPLLNDGTEITPFNFTKGTDNWDPLPDLIAKDPNVPVKNPVPTTKVKAYTYGNRIFLSGVTGSTQLIIYDTMGRIAGRKDVQEDCSFPFEPGCWVLEIVAPDGQKVLKIIIP